MCLLKTVGELKVWKNFPKTCNFKLLNKQIYVLKSKTFPDETSCTRQLCNDELRSYSVLFSRQITKSVQWKIHDYLLKA